MLVLFCNEISEAQDTIPALTWEEKWAAAAAAWLAAEVREAGKLSEELEMEQ